MNDMLSVDFAAVEAAVARLAQAESTVRKILGELEGRASQLRGQWTGAASDAYDTAQAKWSQSADELTTILAATVSGLSAAKARYVAAEKANATRWPG